MDMMLFNCQYKIGKVRKHHLLIYCDIVVMSLQQLFYM